VFFFDDAVEEKTIFEVQNQIETVEGVDFTTYKDKNAALADAMEEFKNSEELIYGLKDDNPFPRSLEVEISNLKFQDEILTRAEEIKKITEAKTHALNPETSSERNDLIRIKSHDGSLVNSFNKTLRFVALGAVLVLGAISAAIIANSVKLTLAARKNEISVMKYVGATNWFIRWPFLIEGIIIGFLGAFISAVLGFLIYARIAALGGNEILKFIGVYAFEPAGKVFATAFPLALGLGIFIGGFGAISGIKKYLDV
jgi:cell division transport system permease protein